jgi:hypothetical protein
MSPARQSSSRHVTQSEPIGPYGQACVSINGRTRSLATIRQA